MKTINISALSTKISGILDIMDEYDLDGFPDAETAYVELLGALDHINSIPVDKIKLPDSIKLPSEELEEVRKSKF